MQAGCAPGGIQSWVDSQSSRETEQPKPLQSQCPICPSTITRSAPLTSIPGSCSGAWRSRAGRHEAHVTAGRKEENLLSFRLFLNQQTKQSSKSHVRKHASQTIQAGLCFLLFTILRNHTHTAPLCDTRGQQGHCLHHGGPSRSAIDGIGK
jgi:hypothetical protein